MDTVFSIYLITNRIDGRVYVGMTSRSVVLRFYEHVVAAYRGRRTPLNEAIVQHTPVAFAFKILTGTPSEAEALKLERQFIKQYQSTNRDLGYNQNLGGSGMAGMKHTPEWRNEHSRRMTGSNHPSYGTKRSAETCKKISDAKKGIPSPLRKIFPSDEIKAAYASGLSLRDIAKQYGTDKGVIGRCLRDLGVILRPKKG